MTSHVSLHYNDSKLMVFNTGSRTICFDKNSNRVGEISICSYIVLSDTGIDVSGILLILFGEILPKAGGLTPMEVNICLFQYCLSDNSLYEFVIHVKSNTF